MYLIIDGYNVLKLLIHNQHVDEHDINKFLKKISCCPIRNKDKIILVFDGGEYWKTREKRKKIEIIYSGSRSSADDEIIIMSNNYKHSAVIVTNDNEIKSLARKNKSILVSVQKFVSTLNNLCITNKVKLNISQAIKTSITVDDDLDALMYNVSIENKKQITNPDMDLINELIKK